MQEKLKVEDDLELSSVPAETVPYVWSSQIEMIERGISKGQGDWGSAEEMLDQILKQEARLLVVHRGDDIIAIVVVSARANKHMMKIFVQLTAGRDIKQWVDIVNEKLLELKDLMGANCIEASCRPGLAKFLKGKGWSQKATIMELR